MKIMILGGFLGSGKTSILLQLGSYLARNANGSKQTKVAIIENEIGQVGIDDKVLRSKGFWVKDIFAGCICCSLSGDLLDGIKEIGTKMDPEWLLIEATGVAFPDKIAEVIMKNLGLPCRLVVLVDASRWQRIRIPMANLIEGQLKAARFILINKIDLVDEATLESVAAEVSQINPAAALSRINGLKSIGEELWRVIIDD